MTAALVRIPTPHDIATGSAFTAGTWRDPGTGLNLPRFLAEHVGPDEARRRLREADEIRQRLRTVVVARRQPRPLPGHGLVWTDPDGFDHDPIFMRQVTVCGLLTPSRLDCQPAGTNPCPDCFDGEPR